jgi:hypothetical protein
MEPIPDLPPRSSFPAATPNFFIWHRCLRISETALGLLNTFEVDLHSGYLCLKVPATFGIITAFDSKKEARSIEHGFTPRHKNVHFLREDAD